MTNLAFIYFESNNYKKLFYEKSIVNNNVSVDIRLQTDIFGYKRLTFILIQTYFSTLPCRSA